MINLLPEKNKIGIKREYNARLVFVSLVFFFIVVMIAIIFQILLYVSISGTERSLSNKLSIYTDNFFNNESILNSEVKNINKKLSILQKMESTRSIYGDIFGVITGDRGNVKITGLSYEKNKAGIMKVRISGNSPNRESIVDFVESLNMEGFTEVNSPVSNFVKNRDIEFSVEIVL